MQIVQNNKLIIYQVLVRLAGNTKANCVPYGTIEQNGCGKFNDLSPVFLKKIKDLGSTHIWLTGVLEHASCNGHSRQGIPAGNPLVIKGVAGSPYAVRDYYDVDPDLAVDVDQRMVEFESLIERCLEAGLSPVIDFIPNHVARIYTSDNKPDGAEDFGHSDDPSKAFLPSNNYYYSPGKSLHLPVEVFNLPYVRNAGIRQFEEFPAKATGNDQFHEHPGFNDWYETVKLNYGVDYMDHHKKYFDPIPDTWNKMLHILLYWAEKKVSGFRCDMAEMVPVEFWQWVIPKVKEKYEDVIFIAEIYNPEAYRDFIEQGKFDFLYDKMGLYDTLRAVVEQKQPASSISGTWQNLESIGHNMLRFVENHDEQRIASQYFGGTPGAGIPASTVSATIHQGPMMIYFGQETGEPATGEAGYSGDDGRTTIFDYFWVPTFQKWFNNGLCDGGLLDDDQKQLYAFYAELLNISKHPVIAAGHFYDLMWANNHYSGFNDHQCYAYLRWDQQHTWLILANFHNLNNISLRVNIPDHFREISGRNPLEHGNAEHVLKTMEKNSKDLSIAGNRLNVELNPFSAIILNIQ